uniref:Phosphatidylserine decarboxylase proenzyme, mitochondrial n=1 Tax=Rhipicephalus zambeziensis TaxID=60191 RepID=A0A224Z5Z8_9ACAR
MWLSHQSLPLLLLTTQRSGGPWLGRHKDACHAPASPLFSSPWLCALPSASLPNCSGRTRHMSSHGGESSPRPAWERSSSPLGASRYLRGLRWMPIPLGLGFACLAYLRSLRSSQGGDDSSPQPVASGLQVSFYRMLPLRMASRWWGWANDIELPVWLRAPVLGLFAWAFRCDVHEAEVEDLRQYRNLGEFFRRSLKPGLRPLCPGDCVVSPADGTVLHFGRIEKGFAEQVKGITYSLPRFLGPHPWDPHCLHTNGEEEYHQKLLQQKDTDLYHCVVYLAPGDYHRFHSPVQWEVQHRRHFPGTLLSVRPGVVNWIAGLFNMNERVVYMGRWQHGFFSMTAVGATNVGSIKVYFDNNLVTNRRKYKKHNFNDQCFQSNHNSEGIHVEKGDPFGEFNLGSTIVLIFEAPRDFSLELKEGQRIKYGELICRQSSNSSCQEARRT